MDLRCQIQSKVDRFKRNHNFIQQLFKVDNYSRWTIIQGGQVQARQPESVQGEAGEPLFVRKRLCWACEQCEAETTQTQTFIKRQPETTNRKAGGFDNQ